MKVVYVAGRFRGASAWEQEQNIRAAEELALEVWRRGAACICPHTNTRFFQGAAPDEVWLEGDLELVKRCDGMLMVPNWRESAGAKSELVFATSLGLPIFYGLEDLERFLQEETERTEQ